VVRHRLRGLRRLPEYVQKQLEAATTTYEFMRAEIAKAKQRIAERAAKAAAESAAAAAGGGGSSLDARFDAQTTASIRKWLKYRSDYCHNKERELQSTEELIDLCESSDKTADEEEEVKTQRKTFQLRAAAAMQAAVGQEESIGFRNLLDYSEWLADKMRKEAAEEEGAKVVRV
jgi:hypothetical protein